MPNHVIGKKVGAVFRETFKDGVHRMMWWPKIQVDGKLIPVSDPSTASGCVEAHSRLEALARARIIRDEIIAKQAKEFANADH